MGYRTRKCGCFWDFYVWVCRLWGILTAIGLWGIGAETTHRQNALGGYLLVAAFVMSFLETVFIVHFWVVFLLREEHHKCVRVWSALAQFDDWRKGILYLLISAGCFAQPKQVWLAIIPGVMLVICSLFYSLKTFKDRNTDLQTEDKNQTYDRFDEVQDDIEENLADTLPGFQEESVADQDEIMDV